jgi:hypothetical protein
MSDDLRSIATKLAKELHDDGEFICTCPDTFERRPPTEEQCQECRRDGVLLVLEAWNRSVGLAVPTTDTTRELHDLENIAGSLEEVRDGARVLARATQGVLSLLEAHLKRAARP